MQCSLLRDALKKVNGKACKGQQTKPAGPEQAKGKGSSWQSPPKLFPCWRSLTAVVQKRVRAKCEQVSLVPAVSRSVPFYIVCKGRDFQEHETNNVLSLGHMIDLLFPKGDEAHVLKSRLQIHRLVYNALHQMALSADA